MFFSYKTSVTDQHPLNYKFEIFLSPLYIYPHNLFSEPSYTIITCFKLSLCLVLPENTFRTIYYRVGWLKLLIMTYTHTNTHIRIYIRPKPSVKLQWSYVKCLFFNRSRCLLVKPLLNNETPQQCFSGLDFSKLY